MKYSDLKREASDLFIWLWGETAVEGQSEMERLMWIFEGSDGFSSWDSSERIAFRLISLLSSPWDRQEPMPILEEERALFCCLAFIFSIGRKGYLSTRTRAEGRKSFSLNQ